MKRKIAITWFLGIITGAGIVIAYQIGDAQRRLVEAWVKVFNG